VRTPLTSHERGASLVEVLIALVVLTVGILAVAQLFPAGSSRQSRNRMVTTANYLAQQKIEQLSRASWIHPDLSVGAHGPESLENGKYQRRWTVEPMAAPLSNLRKVTVDIGFTAYRGDTVQAITYLRR
jgi:type II secretory pathway pseudopilin PulG